jgi:hypothetical protein
MAPGNPFVRAAGEAVAARDALAAAGDFGRFFSGDLAELQKRWGLSAVEFNDGNWGVVAPTIFIGFNVPCHAPAPERGGTGVQGVHAPAPKGGGTFEGVQGYMPMLPSRKGWRVAGGGGGRLECLPTPPKSEKGEKESLDQQVAHLTYFCFNESRWIRSVAKGPSGLQVTSMAAAKRVEPLAGRRRCIGRGTGYMLPLPEGGGTGVQGYMLPLPGGGVR